MTTAAGVGNRTVDIVQRCARLLLRLVGSHSVCVRALKLFSCRLLYYCEDALWLGVRYESHEALEKRDVALHAGDLVKNALCDSARAYFCKTLPLAEEQAGILGFVERTEDVDSWAVALHFVDETFEALKKTAGVQATGGNELDRRDERDRGERCETAREWKLGNCIDEWYRWAGLCGSFEAVEGQSVGAGQRCKDTCLR